MCNTCIHTYVLPNTRITTYGCTYIRQTLTKKRFWYLLFGVCNAVVDISNIALNIAIRDLQMLEFCYCHKVQNKLV